MPLPAPVMTAILSGVAIFRDRYSCCGETDLVGDMWNLALVIPLFAVIGLAGLFIAHAWEEGAMHSAGIALFVVSGAIIFLDMKHVFDRMEPPKG